MTGLATDTSADALSPVLSGGWVAAASADQLAKPGAYVTVDAGPTPLIVLRGQDGELRAFVNMCRHRGMALLQGCGTIESTISCPYHAWKFDTTGRLRVIAQRATQFPDVDPADWGLLVASVFEHAGTVYAHPEAVPAPSPD